MRINVAGSNLSKRRTLFSANAGLPERILFSPLIPFSVIYGLIMRARATYYSNPERQESLPVPVISIGNLNIGGSGKTPVSIACAKLLSEMGRKVAVISRGYRRKNEKTIAIVSDGERILLSPKESGDEPQMVAKRLPGIIVAVGANRAEAARLAIEEQGVDAIVLDDGFQHMKLSRDLNIVVIHGEQAFGSGWPLPRGPLREFPSALRRASLIVINTTVGEKPELIDRLRKLQAPVPPLRFKYQISGLYSPDGTPGPFVTELKGVRVAAFAGTADPESFFGFLNRYGISIATRIGFRDHHWYTEKDFEMLAEISARVGIEYIITTEKDGVKIPENLPAAMPPILIAKVDAKFENEDLIALTKRLEALG